MAGGGNRAFWQLGILERWWPALEPQHGRGGRVQRRRQHGGHLALGAAGGDPRVLAGPARARDAATSSGGGCCPAAGPTPHEPIYRDTLRFSLAEGGLERIRALPFPVLILTASFPRWMPVPLATAAGMTAYSIERQLAMGKLHPRSGRVIGFRPVVVDARTCQAPEDLVDLVLASSATPPFTSIGRHRGRRLLDGGMVDNAPAFVAEHGTGRRSGTSSCSRDRIPTPRSGGREPGSISVRAEPVPINRWDYTSVERVDATVALGRTDAERYADAFGEFLSH